MTDIDLDKLETLADEVLKFDIGWYVLRDCVVAPGGGVAPYHIANVPDETRRAFIAAANPATIKSLIASAREAAAEIERLRREQRFDISDVEAAFKWAFAKGAGTISQDPVGAEEWLSYRSFVSPRAAQMDGEG